MRPNVANIDTISRIGLKVATKCVVGGGYVFGVCAFILASCFKFWNAAIVCVCVVCLYVSGVCCVCVCVCVCMYLCCAKRRTESTDTMTPPMSVVRSSCAVRIPYTFRRKPAATRRVSVKCGEDLHRRVPHPLHPRAVFSLRNVAVSLTATGHTIDLLPSTGQHTSAFFQRQTEFQQILR